MTNIAHPLDSEHDPSPLISPEGALSAEARDLLGQGLLAPAREFGAREDIRSGADYASRQDAMSRARGLHDMSDDERTMVQTAHEAGLAGDIRTLRAMSRGQLQGITDPNAIAWGKTAAEVKLGQITERALQGPVVGRAAVSAAHYADQSREYPQGPLSPPKPSMYVDVRGLGAVHIETHRSE